MTIKYSYFKREKPFYYIKIVLATGLSAFLYACSSDSNDPPSATNTHIQGSVVKGVIKNAMVDIYAVSNGQVETSPLTSVSSNDSGAYSFTLSPDFSGPVMLEVRDNDQNSATMTCDNVGGCAGDVNGYEFGADMPLGSIKLKTYVQNATGGSAHTASITPLTLMAAAYLDTLVENAQAVYNAEWIGKANSQVGNLFTINNIVTTTPPDITNVDEANADSNSLKYALLSAAITSIAQQDHGGNISAAISTLVNSITTTSHEGQLKNSETVSNPDEISLTEMLDSAQMLSMSLPIQFTYSDSVASELSNLLTLAQSDPNEYSNAQPSPTSGMGDLDKVKAFVADVRTWSHVIDEEINANTGELRQHLDMAEITFYNTEPLFDEAISNAINASLEVYATTASINDLSTYFSPTDPTNPVTATGSAILDGNTVTVDGVINGINIVIALEFPGSLSGTVFTIGVNSVTVYNNEGELNVTTPGSVTLDYANSFAQGIDLTPWADGTLSTPFPDPDSVSLGISAQITELNVVNPITFEGDLTFMMIGSQGDGQSVVRDELGHVVQYNPSSAVFNGTLAQSGTNNSLSVTFSATMPNANTFMLPDPLEVGYVHTALGNYAFTNPNSLSINLPGFTRTFDYNPNTQYVTMTDASPDYNDTIVLPGQYLSLATYLASGDYYITSDIWWIWVDGEGSYNVTLPTLWDPNGGDLDGILLWPDQLDEDENHFREFTDITITFAAQLEGLPQAQFTLTGDRTGYEDGNVELNISYGARQIHAIGNVVQGVASGAITITNQDGVVLTINSLSGVINGTSTDVSGNVVYDQTQYATIETVRGVPIIHYNDGYFETF